MNNQAKISVYYYSQIGDLERLTNILSNHRPTNISLAFALYLACKNANVLMVNYLINFMSKNESVICDNGLGQNIMAAACYGGNMEIIDLLIEHQFVLSVISLNKICKIKDPTMRTIMIKWIVDKIEVDDWETAVINLLKVTDSENVLYLLDKISSDKILPMLTNILRMAAFKNNVLVFDWLLAKYSNIILDDDHTLAVCIGHFFRCNNYTHADIVLNLSDVISRTNTIDFMTHVCYNARSIECYQYIAAKYNLKFDHKKYEFIRCLTEAGKFDLLVSTIEMNKCEYDLNIDTNAMWKSCLEHCFRSACCYGYLEIAKWLYDLGIDPSCECLDGEYYEEDHGLVLAAKNNHLDIVKWLLSIQPINSEIYSKALYKAVRNNETYCCIEFLIKNSPEPVDYVDLYLGCFKKSIEMVLWFDENYRDKLIDHKFVDREFARYATLTISQINFLIGKHPELTETFVKYHINLTYFGKDLGTMKKYFDEYNDWIYLDFNNNDTYYLLFNVSLHENNEIYHKSVKYMYYHYFGINLRHWMYDDLARKINNNSVDKIQVNKIFTDILSTYDHNEDRYDYLYDPPTNSTHTMEDYYYGTTINVPIKEKLEYVKILDFCTKYNIVVDYNEVFKNQLNGETYFEFTVGKISSQYITEVVNEHFHQIDICALKELLKIFPHLSLDKIPTQSIFWNRENIDKIKFLFNFFKDNDFYPVFTGYMDICNAQYILDNTALELYEYENIASVIGKYKNYNIIDDPCIMQIVNTLCEKHGNRAHILDIYLLNSMIGKSENVLDKLCELGATIHNDQDISATIVKCMRNSSHESIKWLHKKGINLRQYQKCILKVIGASSFHEILDFAKFLEEIGFEQIHEYALASYIRTDGNYEDDEYTQYVQSHYDEKLVKILNIYHNTAQQFMYKQEFVDTDFNTEAETFDFTTGNFMFFKVVAIISGNFHKDKYNFDSFVKLFAMIKYYYPRVTFICNDDGISFTIKSIKSSRNI